MLIETKPPSIGIIGTYKIQYPNLNPLDFFIPNASSIDNGEIETLITWNSSFQTKGITNGAYVTIEFKDHFVHPTGYALKGFKDKYFARIWMFQGIDDQGNIIDIEQNTSTGSLFCSDNENDTCSNMEWGTFELKTLPPKAFKKLRWTIIQGSNIGGYHIALSGIEIYGTLSETGKMYHYPNIIQTFIYRAAKPNLFVYLFMISLYR